MLHKKKPPEPKGAVDTEGVLSGSSREEMKHKEQAGECVSAFQMFCKLSPPKIWTHNMGKPAFHVATKDTSDKIPVYYYPQ